MDSSMAHDMDVVRTCEKLFSFYSKGSHDPLSSSDETHYIYCHVQNKNNLPTRKCFQTNSKVLFFPENNRLQETIVVPFDSKILENNTELTLIPYVDSS